MTMTLADFNCAFYLPTAQGGGGAPLLCLNQDLESRCKEILDLVMERQLELGL